MTAISRSSLVSHFDQLDEVIAMVYHRSEGASAPTPTHRAPSTQQANLQPQNAFRNDGSFLEMFKRMQQATSSAGSSSSSSSTQDSNKPVTQSPPRESACPTVPTSIPNASCSTSSSGDESSKDGVKRAPIVGKRRGGRILPTGVVKKRRPDEEESGEKPKDAWSLYMAEVRRYKESSCEEDGKTRPLVK